MEKELNGPKGKLQLQQITKIEKFFPEVLTKESTLQKA